MFDIRLNGALERYGAAGDLPIKADKPTWLRLERKGNQMLGSASHDGENWTYGEAKELRVEAWRTNSLSAGVAAISNTQRTFTPAFSELSIKQGNK